MANVYDVAKYILEEKGYMSTWKLQKLCYYSQAWSLAWSDNVPLFVEDFQAWRNGPVCPDLFREHKGKYMIDASELEKGSSGVLSKEEIENIDLVLKEYGDKEPYYLRESTHKEEPWIISRGNLTEDENSENIITKESMGCYYGSL